MELEQFGTNKFKMTWHAASRVQQRGIRKETIDLVLYDSDIELHAGEGLMSLQLSRKRLGQLARSGVPATLRESAQGVVLLVDFSTRSVVSAMHGRGRLGKRFSRQFPTRSRASGQRSARVISEAATVQRNISF